MSSTFEFIWGNRKILNSSKRMTDNRHYKVGLLERCRKCRRKSCHNCTQQFSYRTRRDDNQAIGKLYMGD